jgi:hypothetical protein
MFAALALGALAGCASPGSKSGPKAGTLTAADFRSADAASIAPAAMAERRVPTYRTEPTDPDAPAFTVLEGAPTLEPDTPPVADPNAFMMDSLVGDINGTPVYATAFFAPIDARLAGLAAKHRNNVQVWTAEARKIIATQLGDMIRDQLLLAEARSSLTPEQKQGLLNFIDVVRRDLVSRGGGGQAAVDESLREQGEKGLEAKLKENIDRQLISANLREKVLPRATVSWHEVQVEYDRRAEKFNPDPTAVFRVIWLPTKKPELVEQFKSELARGVSFDELAERPENEFPDNGVLKQVFKGEYSKAPLFGPKELNEPAQALRVGDVTGPIVFNDWTCWLSLEEIDTPKAMSIYEAQLAIHNELREKKIKAESDKYLSNLLDRQSFTKLNDMGDKLLTIATDRYFGAAAKR